MLAKKQPLKAHENILIFSKGKTIYNPEMAKGDKNHATKDNTSNQRYLNRVSISPSNVSSLKYPRSVIKFKSTNAKYNLHPTQKPVALFEYLIKTYTNEGDIIFDGFIGSGTTAIACINTKRNYIGCELSKKYFDIAEERIKNLPTKLF
jgi:site-specific DNA-methyltransferase (adenine-specific)